MQDSQASNKKTIHRELQFLVFCALLSSNVFGKLDILVAAAVQLLSHVPMLFRLSTAPPPVHLEMQLFLFTMAPCMVHSSLSGTFQETWEGISPHG